VKEEVEMVVNRTGIVEAARQLGINGKPGAQAQTHQRVFPMS